MAGRIRVTVPSGTRFFLVPLAVMTLVALAVPAQRADAHPLGNFTVNRYARIGVYNDLLRVTYVLDLAEIPSFQELPAIDADSNGASPDELAAWASRLSGGLLPGLTLSLDGVTLPLRATHTSGASAPGQANLPTLRLEVVYEAALPAEAPRGAPGAVTFRDTNYIDRIGWRELVVEASPGARVTSVAGYVDRSTMLREYPASSLSDAPDERAVSFEWVVGTGRAAPDVGRANVGIARSTGSGFEALIVGETSSGRLLLSLIAAAGFGMLHALGPGHGKALVAAFLVGNRGTPRHAIGLGLTVTATHTAAVYVLGATALIASRFFVPERLYLGLNIASGVLVMAFGIGLFSQRLRVARGRGQHSHRHNEAGGHTHAFGSHHHHGSDHQHEAADPLHDDGDHRPRTSWRSVLTLGVLGGLLPCPSAIVVMLAAISLGQVLYGMLLIVAFSAGLAAVLTGLGLAVVAGHGMGARLQSRHAGTYRFATRTHRAVLLASPIGIALIGLALTIQALRDAPSGLL